MTFKSKRHQTRHEISLLLPQSRKPLSPNCSFLLVTPSQLPEARRGVNPFPNASSSTPTETFRVATTSGSRSLCKSRSPASSSLSSSSHCHSTEPQLLPCCATPLAKLQHWRCWDPALLLPSLDGSIHPNPCLPAGPWGGVWKLLLNGKRAEGWCQNTRSEEETLGTQVELGSVWLFWVLLPYSEVALVPLSHLSWSRGEQGGQSSRSHKGTGYTNCISSSDITRELQEHRLVTSATCFFYSRTARQRLGWVSEPAPCASPWNIPVSLKEQLWFKGCFGKSCQEPSSEAEFEPWGCPSQQRDQQIDWNWKP